MNYLRFILANYLRIQFAGADAPVTYDEMHNEIIKNGRGYYLERTARYQPPHPIMRKTGYKDIVFGHNNTALEFADAPRLFLYRNPLDTIVSMYFYKWKQRPRKKHLYNHPREVAGIVLDDFIHRYKFMKLVTAQSDRALMISYEALKTVPEATMSFLLQWLGLPFEASALRKAIAFSDIKVVREDETRRGHAIHAPAEFEGFFTRSGKIGQWRKYFDADDLKRIERRLVEEGITLEEFVLVDGLAHDGRPHVAVAQTSQAG